MIVIRLVFQAKIHRGGAVAQAMAAGLPQIMAALPAAQGWRLLTDLSGPFDTVVLEIKMKSLADWERGRAGLFESPGFQLQVAASDVLITAGRSEFYTVEVEG
jgi:hypothetical protein